MAQTRTDRVKALGRGASSRRRRGGVARLARWLWFAPLLLIGVAGVAQGPTTQPAGVSDRVLSELRAAHAARAQLLRAEQAWALDKEKLELLRGTLRDEAERLTAAAAEAARKESDLREQSADLQARRERLKQVEAMIDSLSERLEQALEALARRALPGLVPPDAAAHITEPARRLAAAADRLGDVERRARKSAIELVLGMLAGEEVTVKLLHAGGAVAWWTSLDGKQSGTAAMEEGKLVLSPARTAKDAAAIKKAFAIVEGRAAPVWLLLPLDAAVTKPPGG